MNMNNDKRKGLRRFNLIMGFFHLVQGGFMLFISLNWDKVKEFQIPIFSNFLVFDQKIGALVTATEEVFKLPFGVMVAAFLFLSAFFHFLIAAPKLNDVYNRQIEGGINQFRWYEYALSSSIMIVLIAALFGMYDIGSLILLFALNATMNLFGLMMEKYNQLTARLGGRVEWTSFVYGTFAGLVPWVVVLMYSFGNADPSEVPWFVYAIIGSYFVFFNTFPVNMVLQYKKVGPWKDYAFGERGYIVLSLVAKSVLAWLVFAGVMQPK